MNKETTQADFIFQSIHLVQKLRHDVGQVFKDLADGISEYIEEPAEKDEHDATSTSSKDGSKDKTASQEQKESTGASHEKSEEHHEKHRAILKTLKKSLEIISHDFSDLEKTGINIGPVQMFSNIDNLSLDPVDKNTVTHSQLLQSYKWTNKMHELADQAVSILSQNTLKRTQSPKFTYAKKMKGNMLSAWVAPQPTVDQCLSVLNQDHPGSIFTWSRPLGSCAALQIEIGKTLKAVVVLRGLTIEWVKVKGFDESFKTDDGQIDIWSASRYQVFQKLTHHAEAASLHFYAPGKPDLAIKSFIMWLHGFSNLFSAPCQKCGKYLQNNMPPTWRDYRSRKPFHDVCRM